MLQCLFRRRRIVGWALTLGVVTSFNVQATKAADQPASRYELADLEALQRAFTKLAEDVRPSVVAIRTYRTLAPHDLVGRLIKRPYSQGSGFIIAADGYIATNRHVIEGADVISVILHNGFSYEAKLIEDDRRLDLSVIKIDAQGLRAVRFGPYTGLKVNHWVFACGNPFGLANDDGQVSITYGVVSALGRQMTHRLVGDSQIEYYGNMIETSAAINPGSSGGPLFNLHGEVIGVVTAIETSSGVTEGHGFAIPMNRNTHRVLNRLKAGKPVRYGFLGVKVMDVDPPDSRLVVDASNLHGAQLTEIDGRSSPAGKAGLIAGDIIIEYDDQPVQNSDHLVRLVGFTPVGAKVAVVYLRRGTRRKTMVTVGDRYELMSHAGLRE